MKDASSLRTASLVTFAGLLTMTAVTAAVLAACADTADTNDTPIEPSPDGGESTTITPPLDASETDDGEVDAGGDAAVDGSDDVDAGLRICSDDDFCHSDVPAGTNLVGVWGDGQGIVWTVSNKGDVLRWDGSAWNVHAHLTDTTGTKFSIWGTGPTDVWAVTPAGLFHGTGPTSAALVFTLVDLPGDTTIPILSVGGTGPNDVWAVGGVTNSSKVPWDWRARILHYDGDTSNGGSGWTVDTTLSSKPVAVSAVLGSPGTGMWLVGQEYRQGKSPSLYGALFRRAPGTDTWTAIDLPPDPKGTTYGPQARDLLTIGLSSDSSLWIRGQTSDTVPGFWRGTSTDGGGTFVWSFTRSNTWDRPIVGLWGTGLDDTWGVGGSGLVTHWNGTKWQQAAIRLTDLPVNQSFTAIWGKSKDDFWVVGSEIALHRTLAGKP
ncbi:hypothetical protein AKJ09_06858 [Labilithrix luteola]|uniref:Type IV fimbrial biogenesis protein PilY1 n=1 Tax=Labilithrix luteola TaxID=1391654 RepID=A0A0K1Q484_9BACT|nr:hypothetical protein [Labilithrix luteola]AKV00195.1 hypothetical protein AKJ09_06858 [Labilithrix luteola]